MAGNYARSGELIALFFVAHRVPDILPACIVKVRKMVGWISGHQQRGTYVHVCNIYLAGLCKGLATDGWCRIEHETTIMPLHLHNDDLQVTVQAQRLSREEANADTTQTKSAAKVGCQRQRCTETQSHMQVCSTPLPGSSNFGSPLTSCVFF